MKKIFVIIAALAFTVSAMAQQGKIFVTGSLDFNSSSMSTKATINNNSTTTDNPASSNFGIGLQGHYMITDNIAVGLGLGYNASKSFSFTISNNDLFYRNSLLDISPSVIYFISIADKFQYAPELAIRFGFGGETYESWDFVNKKIIEETDDISYFGFGLMPLNFNYNINDNLALSFGLGEIAWASYKITDNFSVANTLIDRTSSDFNIRLNSTFRIGLRYFF